MKTVTTKAMAKVAAVATGLAMATSMFALAPMVHAAALTDAQVQSILGLLTSFGADSTTIANVQASLTGGTPTNTGGGTVTTSCSFTTDLTVGSTGADVTCLQRALLGAGFSIPALSSGAASYGYFGSQTVTAVIAWQKSVGVTPASGYFGPISRAHWNLGTGNTGGTGTGTGAGTGTGLKVSLAATSPSGTVLVQGQGIGDLAEFTFANPTASPINVTGLTFNRTGVSNDDTLSNVYLYNNGTRITDSAGISAGQFSYSNAGGLFTVPAGMTYTIAVRSDIAANTSGQQLGVSLVSVSSTGTLDSSVTFPIMSGYQTISAANLATVNFNSNVLPAATTISPQSDYTLWQDTVSVSTNPVKLASMKFTNLGSADSSAVTNLRLYVDGTQVGSAVSSLASDRTITFDFSSNPMLLSTQSHIIKVLGNIVGGASRTIQFSVQRSSDGMFIDNQLNQPVTPLFNNLAFTSANGGVITMNSTGVAGVSVNKSPSSPINNIPVGASNVKLASFDMLASGEATKVMDLYVCANTSVHNGGLDNGKILVNGVQVGSTKDLSECSTNTDFSLGSSLILPAGQTTMVDVYADAKTSTSTNLSNTETVQITLAAGSSNAQGQTSLSSTNVPATALSGNSLSVTSSSLTATKFSGYSNQTMIPGSTNARVGSFTLSSGSNEDINVNTITINSSTTQLTNLTLKDNATGTTLGSVIPTPSVGNNSFSVNLTVPMSGTKTIDVYANILTSATASFTLGIPSNGVTGTGASTGTSATANAVQLQAISVGSGTLSVGIGASNPVSSNVVAGASSLKVGDFTFNAVNSSFTVQKLEVDVPAASAAAITSLSIQYKDQNGVTQTSVQALQATNVSTSTATFSGLSFFVPQNDSANVSVWVSTPTVANGGGISGVKIVAALPATPLVTNSFQAVDTAGNATTSPYTWTADVNSNGSTGYGTLVLRKSVPTFAMQTVSTANLAAGQAIYRVNVTADPAGAIDLDQLSFNVATSSSGLAGFTLYDITSGTAVVLNASTVEANSSNVVKIKFDALQQVGAGQTKTYELRAASISSWAQGDSVSISLAQDSAYVANNTVANLLTGNVIWSDRSSTTHSSQGVAATDWTNGYLLKDFVSDVTSFTHS